jgi:hypothetical protein
MPSSAHKQWCIYLTRVRKNFTQKTSVSNSKCSYAFMYNSSESCLERLITVYIVNWMSQEIAFKVKTIMKKPWNEKSHLLTAEKRLFRSLRGAAESSDEGGQRKSGHTSGQTASQKFKNYTPLRARPWIAQGPPKVRPRPAHGSCIWKSTF